MNENSSVVLEAQEKVFNMQLDVF